MKRIRCLLPLLAMLGIGVLLSACSTQLQGPIKDSAPPYDIDATKIPDAVPKAEPLSKYGNPKSYVIHGYRYHVLPSAKGYSQKGIASWYGWGFHGRNTSTNEKYDSLAMTAASPVLPLPTYVHVTNLDNGKKIIVKVNDRGPFVPHSNRIIDLSYAAAKKLGYAGRGTARVLVTAIDPVKWHASKASNVTPSSPSPLAKVEVPAKIPASAINEKIYLQLGAFSKRINAEQLKQKVARLVVKPITIAPTSSQHLYRVQIGPLESAAESHKITALLAEHGFKASVVTSAENSA